MFSPTSLNSKTPRDIIRAQIVPPDMPAELGDRLVQACFVMYRDDPDHRGVDANVYTFMASVTQMSPWPEYPDAADWYARSLEGVALPQWAGYDS
jgi:hypothetical protein